MTPAQNSAVKVAINFGVVVVAFWAADYSKTAYTNWKASRAASKAGAPTAGAGTGGAGTAKL